VNVPQTAENEDSEGYLKQDITENINREIIVLIFQGSISSKKTE
jgi:hypothetical protein